MVKKGKGKKKAAAKKAVKKPVLRTTPEQAKAGYKLYKKREVSAYGKCVGKEMKGEKRGKTITKAFQTKFVEACIACGATVRPAKKKKFGIKG